MSDLTRLLFNSPLKYRLLMVLGGVIFVAIIKKLIYQLLTSISVVFNQIILELESNSEIIC